MRLNADFCIFRIDLQAAANHHGIVARAGSLRHQCACCHTASHRHADSVHGGFDRILAVDGNVPIVCCQSFARDIDAADRIIHQPCIGNTACPGQSSTALTDIQRILSIKEITDFDILSCFPISIGKVQCRAAGIVQYAHSTIDSHPAKAYGLVGLRDIVRGLTGQLDAACVGLQSRIGHIKAHACTLPASVISHSGLGRTCPPLRSLSLQLVFLHGIIRAVQQSLDIHLGTIRSLTLVGGRFIAVRQFLPHVGDHHIGRNASSAC